MLKRDTVGLIQSDIQNRRIKQAQICSKGHFAPVYFCKIKKSGGGKMGIGSTNGIRRRAKKEGKRGYTFKYISNGYSEKRVKWEEKSKVQQGKTGAERRLKKSFEKGRKKC